MKKIIECQFIEGDTDFLEVVVNQFIVQGFEFLGEPKFVVMNEEGKDFISGVAVLVKYEE